MTLGATTMADKYSAEILTSWVGSGTESDKREFAFMSVPLIQGGFIEVTGQSMTGGTPSPNAVVVRFHGVTAAYLDAVIASGATELWREEE